MMEYIGRGGSVFDLGCGRLFYGEGSSLFYVWFFAAEEEEWSSLERDVTLPDGCIWIEGAIVFFELSSSSFWQGKIRRKEVSTSVIMGGHGSEFFATKRLIFLGKKRDH